VSFDTEYVMGRHGWHTRCPTVALSGTSVELRPGVGICPAQPARRAGSRTVSVSASFLFLLADTNSDSVFLLLSENVVIVCTSDKYEHGCCDYRDNDKGWKQKLPEAVTDDR
jgi:hypothetical protein